VEKTVIYPLAKFTVEAIKEAEAVLGGKLESSDLTVASTAHQSWQFDDADEFFAQYEPSRKSCRLLVGGVSGW